MRCLLAKLLLIPSLAFADAKAQFGTFSSTTDVATTQIEVDFPAGNQFTPKVIFFWSNDRTELTNTVSSTNHRRAAGVAISATSRHAVASASDDGEASADAANAIREDSCIFTINTGGAGSVDGQLDLVSMDADGFTVVIDNQFDTSIRVHYLALGGSDITNVDRHHFEEPASTGSESLTPFSFQPDVLFFLNASTGTDPPSLSHLSSRMVTGFSNGSSNYVLMGGSDDGDATTTTGSYLKSGESHGGIVFDVTGIDSRASVTSLDATGFTQNWPEVVGTATRDYFVVGVKGGNWALGDLLTQTDTITTIQESGFGFAPVAAMFMSAGNVESTSDTLDSDDDWSLGAYSWDGSNLDQGAMQIQDEDGQATTDTMSAVNYDNVYLKGTNGSLFGAMTVQSSDSDGFTCIMTDADPSPQRYVAYWAFGPEPTPTPTLTPSVRRGIDLKRDFLLSLSGGCDGR